MPNLLAKPGVYLCLLLGIASLIVADAARPPAVQIVGGWYVAAVLEYQHYARPLMIGIVQCRYQPTCSEYSLQAVKRLGLGRGLLITIRRIYSCRASVPMGTSDPVPDK